MWVKKFQKFKESITIDLEKLDIEELNESMSIFVDSLLRSIDAQKIELAELLKSQINSDLNFLDDNSDFISKLSDIGLRKSDIINSSDYETYLNIPCRFILLYRKESSDLDNPLFLLMQIYDDNKNIWSKTNTYKINGNINDFYNQLSSKTIEIEDNGEKYIYETGDTNTWTMKSVEETDVFKRTLTNEELKEILERTKAKVKII